MRAFAIVAACVAAAVGVGGAAMATREEADAGEEPRRVAASQGDGCPVAQPAGRLAARAAARALEREIPRAYADTTAQGERRAWRGYSVTALFSLDPAAARSAWPQRMLRPYRRAAIRLCGQAVADRSWVVLVHLPRAVGALQAEGVAFLARTATGWRIWATTVGSELPSADLVDAS